MRALVLGGAACVWHDLVHLGLQLRPFDGLVLACNDIAVHYPHRIDHFCTLHAAKLLKIKEMPKGGPVRELPGWLEQRRARGGNMDFTTWGRVAHRGIDRVLGGWSNGSSGLFTAGVALHLGCTEVILCGVPMATMPHFFDDIPWTAHGDHTDAWLERLEDLRGRVFSMSGWTRELLGPPPWLDDLPEAA